VLSPLLSLDVPALAERAPRSLSRPAAVLALGVLVGCAWRSTVRADVWRSEITLMLDAAAHYPNGMQANLLRAQSAARRGDAGGAAQALRAASARGFDRFMDLDRDPLFASVHDDPRFQAALRDVAGRWIAAVEPRGDPTSLELLMLGRAHAARGEWQQAAQSLERALAAGGPGSEEARDLLAEVRARQLHEQAQRDAGGSAGGEATP